jgi:hypothetical protein
MNIMPVKERRMNFDATVYGHTKSDYLWGLLAATIALVLVYAMLAV